MRIAVWVAGILLFAGGNAAVAQEAADTPCPVRIKSVRLSPVIGRAQWGNAPEQRKLSFRYQNLSGRDIESISLRIDGRMFVSGPAGSSKLETSKRVTVEGPMAAGKSGKKSVTFTLVPDQPGDLVVTEVKFADGSVWTNAGGADCIAERR